MSRKIGRSMIKRHGQLFRPESDMDRKKIRITISERKPDNHTRKHPQKK